MEKISLFMITELDLLEGINLNDEINFSPELKSATVLTVLRLLPREFFHEKEGELFINELLNHLNVKHSLDKLIRLYDQNDVTKIKGEEFQALQLNDFNFLKKPKTDSSNEEDDLDDHLKQFLNTKSEKYSFYKIIIMAAVFHKSLNFDKVERLLELRTKLNLENKICTTISSSVGKLSGDLSFKQIKGMKEMDFVFLSALKEVLLNDDKIDKGEASLLKGIWDSLKHESKKRNVLESYLVKSLLPETKNFRQDLGDKKHQNTLHLISKVINDLEPDKNKLNLIIEELESFHLKIEDIVTMIEEGAIENISYQEIFKKIPGEDQVFTLIEAMSLYLKYSDTEGPLNEVWISLIEDIDFSQTDNCSVEALLIIEFLLVNIKRVETIGPFCEKAINKLKEYDPDQKPFQLLILSYHVQNTLKRNINLDESDLEKVMKVLSLSNISQSISKTFLENEELKNATLRVLFLAELPLLIEKRKEDLTFLNKFVNAFFNVENAHNIKEYVIRIVLTGFVSNDQIQEKVSNQGKAFVTNMVKAQRDFFNDLVDGLGVDDFVIRRIIYHIALATGVLFKFNEKLIYGK
jgi:hypothetical protein